MPAAPLPPNERQRLAALACYPSLDGERDDWTDEVAAVAAALTACPIALVSIVDADRQWFKGCVGVDVNETPRSQAFCGYSILSDVPLVVDDATRDQRFSDNELVTGPPHIRFYAGAPLIDAEGFALGTLCAIDTTPRTLAPNLIEALTRLSAIVVRHLTARRRTEAAEAASARAHQHADELAGLNRSLARSREELAAKNDELERFVYTASHDLKSPLLTLQGYAGHVKRDLAAGRTDRIEEFAGRIDAATRRMRDNIDDLLELSRIGRATREPELVDVAAVVGEVAEAFATLITERGATLEVDSATPHVWADRSQLRQALENLIGNALKYGMATDRPPRITVGANIVGREAQVFVADNGPGIAPEYHARIFELFQRLETTGDGTGVGLAIVHRIADVHGGRTWLESAPGEGATFLIGLPMADGDLDAARGAEAPDDEAEAEAEAEAGCEPGRAA